MDVVSTLLEILDGALRGVCRRGGKAEVSTLLEILVAAASATLVVASKRGMFQPFLRF